jgi:hypothetical protein
MHAKPIALIRFSMNLYFAHTPISIWKMLSLLHFAISRTSTMQLYNIGMTTPIHQQLLWDLHPTTAVIGADNMHYITYVRVPHMDVNGKVRYSQVCNTINIWQMYPSIPIANFDEPDRKMLPNITPGNLEQIVNVLHMKAEHVNNNLDFAWRHATNTIHQHHALSAYPVAAERVQPPCIEIHKPIHNASTSSYKDVEKFLEWMW